METFPIIAEDGSRVLAFEIENIYIGPGAIARLLTIIEGVTNVKQRKMFSKSSDVHIEFQYHGEPCVVWEPYGDSSRYWIGPKDSATRMTNIARLEAAFKRYRPTLFRLIIGDLLTFRFIRRFLFKD